MTEILPKRRKTLSNQSIINMATNVPYYNMPVMYVCEFSLDHHFNSEHACNPWNHSLL